MKKTRIFLGNAPWRKPGYYGVRAGSRWPHFEDQNMEYMPFPFFLAYAAAILEDDDFPVLLVDAIAENIDNDAFLSRMRGFKPDVIVLEVSTNSIAWDMAILKRIRAEFPEALLIAAGLHSEMYRPEFLRENPEIDAVLVGEYEFTLREFCQRKEDGLPLAGIKGVIIRIEQEIHDAGRRPLEPDLTRYPWPARHFLPMFAYRDEPGNLPRPSVQIWASRGCPFHCSFCAWPQIMYDSHKYRVRPIPDVVDEMEWLAKEYGFASAYFDDDTFNVGKPRMLEFAREVSSRNLDLPFGIMARADLMDREILEALREAGLWGLKYGVESAEQSLLDHCGKGLDIRKVRESIRITHELGIKMHLTFMFGLPGETLDTARRTIDMALESAPESVQFTVATPFPGSRYWDEVTSRNMLESTDFTRFDGFRSAVVRTDDLNSRQLEEILKEANRRWETYRARRANAT
jgi:anaerobic magnesium-protoporphyrin IX monomethyl ester cyclase